MGAPRTVTRQAICNANLPRGHARRQSCNTAIASFDRGAEPRTRDQSEDARQVAKAWDSRGSQNGSEGSALHRFKWRRRGDGSCFPPAHSAAARRLFLCLAAFDPAPDTVFFTPLHRCLQRRGISRLPRVEGDKPKRQKFKRYPIGFFHIDIAEVQTEEGKLYLFVGIDRTSKFAVTQLVEKANRETAWEFLEHLLKAVPYRIHTILTPRMVCKQTIAGQWTTASSSPSSHATGTLHIRAKCAST